MANLDDGSGRPGLASRATDHTKAGVATRVVTGSVPSDADWGIYGPPPNGTMVFDTEGILYVRLAGAWKAYMLADLEV